MVIEHDNIIYMSDIAELGGTSTFVYELVKKYKDRDIAVVYKTADIRQLIRIKQYCRAYELHPSDRIKCKVCIINYDTSELNQIESQKIWMVFHADYSHAHYKSYPVFDKRITGYISITKHIQKAMKEKFGIESIVSYNPLDVEKKKRLVLVSATRLTKIKGKDRIVKLGEALNGLGIDYVWYIFTNDVKAIDNENIIYMKPRIDVIKWIQEADYVVQLSDSEGLSYTINEAVYSGIPVIVTPLPYLDEIGIKDGVNAYILDFDCGNVKDVATRMKKVPKFNFEPLKDNYDKILAKGKSRYRQELNTIVKVICIKEYKDILLNRVIKPYDKENNNEILEMNLMRAEYLEEVGVVKIYKEDTKDGGKAV